MTKAQTRSRCEPFLAAPEIDPRGSYVWWTAGDDDDAEEVSEDEGV